MAFLLIEYPQEHRVGIIKGRVLIGRWSLNSIIVDDRAVSRIHAWIGQQDGRDYVCDVGSRTGTLVNGTAQVDRRYLSDGDKIEIGPVALVYRTGDHVPTDLIEQDLTPHTPEELSDERGVYTDCQCGAPHWIPRGFTKNGRCRYCGRGVKAEKGKTPSSSATRPSIKSPAAAIKAAAKTPADSFDDLLADLSSPPLPAKAIPDSVRPAQAPAEISDLGFADEASAIPAAPANAIEFPEPTPAAPEPVDVAPFEIASAEIEPLDVTSDRMELSDTALMEVADREPFDMAPREIAPLDLGPPQHTSHKSAPLEPSAIEPAEADLFPIALAGTDETDTPFPGASEPSHISDHVFPADEDRVLELATPRIDGATEPPAARAVPLKEQRCGVCHTSITAFDEVCHCPSCKLAFHTDCWTENRGCSAFGCSQVGVLERHEQSDEALA